MSKPKAEVIAFNAGEFGAEALARWDIENYSRGAEEMENIIPLVQGGMTLAPGTIFVSSTPNNNTGAFVPFSFNESTAFALEFTDSVLRIISDGGVVVLEGADATVGTFTDESTVAPTGGGAAPSSGAGSPDVSPGYTGPSYETDYAVIDP